MAGGAVPCLGFICGIAACCIEELYCMYVFCMTPGALQRTVVLIICTVAVAACIYAEAADIMFRIMAYPAANILSRRVGLVFN